MGRKIKAQHLHQLSSEGTHFATSHTYELTGTPEKPPLVSIKSGSIT